MVGSVGIRTIDRGFSLSGSWSSDFKDSKTKNLKQAVVGM